MKMIVRGAGGITVALFGDGEWTFVDPRLGEMYATLSGTGMYFLDGEPQEGPEPDVIADTMTWVYPGDPRFELLFAEELEMQGYEVEGITYVGD